MIIGLHGPARSGKDQTFQFIKELSTPNVVVRRDAFADRLKISAARAIGFDGTPEECIEFCNWLKEKGEVITYPIRDFDERAYVSGREYLQRYGTEAHREVFGYDFWIRAVIPENYVSPPSELLVITDVRFENEAQAVRQANGVVWRIERPEAGIAESEHASEQALPEYLIDDVITNHGDLEYLRNQIRLALNNLVVWVPKREAASQEIRNG